MFVSLIFSISLSLIIIFLLVNGLLDLLLAVVLCIIWLYFAMHRAGLSYLIVSPFNKISILLQ